MTKKIKVEPHPTGWCLRDDRGNCLIAMPNRIGLDLILRQMNQSVATDQWHVAHDPVPHPLTIAG